jgi:succinate dehydrogenase / fumarate reductase cytochrome b subunit
MPPNNRPLSPHLQIYSHQLTSVMSIIHRLTGVALAIGSLGLLWVLVSISLGGEYFTATQACLSSLLGKTALFLLSACLMYHLFNGIRHLFWDAGKGYELANVYRSGYVVILLTLLSTAALWFVALSQGGSL